MFERFTDRARRVVVLAQEEARLLNHNYIGTEHLLLGLVHEGEGIAAQALISLGVSLERVRHEVEEIIGQGDITPSGHIPFTPRAKKVLELSLREALALHHNYIGTEHIVLGLLREGEGVAAEVLVKLGADLPKVKQRVIELLATGPEATSRLTIATPMSEELQPAAFELARTLDHPRMGTEHLLLALLSTPKSGAARFLKAEKIDVAGLKTRLQRALKEAEDSTDP